MSATGRELVKVTAKEVAGCGWVAPDPFNIVTYVAETVAEGFQLLELVSVQTLIGARANRKAARRVAHALQSTLRDLGAVQAEIGAAADSVPNGEELPDAESVAIMVLEYAERRRAEMALGAVGLPTATRGPKMISSFDRLLDSLARAGWPPVGRAYASVASRSRPTRAPDERGDNGPGLGADDFEDPDVMPASRTEPKVAIARGDVVFPDEGAEGEEENTKKIPARPSTLSPRSSPARDGRGPDATGARRKLIGGLPDDDGWA